MTIKFPDPESWHWDDVAEEVQFDVEHAPVLENRREHVTCRITREFIEDHLGKPKGANACLKAARRHRNLIEEHVGHYLGAGRLEPDGSLLIRSKDFIRVRE